MADWVNLLMLVCACIGSMAFGILAAYAMLRTGFSLMGRSQRPAVVKVRTQVARVS
jgi:ABC-type glycerol-3-phosphate transport system permease component